jgi:hypothetical protein
VEGNIVILVDGDDELVWVEDEDVSDGNGVTIEGGGFG